MVSFTPDAERRGEAQPARAVKRQFWRLVYFFREPRGIRANSGRKLHQDTLDHPVNCQNKSNFQIKIPRVTNANTQTNRETTDVYLGCIFQRYIYTTMMTVYHILSLAACVSRQRINKRSVQTSWLQKHGVFILLGYLLTHDVKKTTSEYKQQLSRSACRPPRRIGLRVWCEQAGAGPRVIFRSASLPCPV